MHKYAFAMSNLLILYLDCGHFILFFEFYFCT